jgi:hypothetical protein
MGAVVEGCIPASLIKTWLDEDVGLWRERIYSRLTTLKMFMGQVLNADQTCQEAVIREAARSTQPRSLNTGPYCAARKRLNLALIERFGREVGARLSAAGARAWRWRGREVKLADGTTLSMPDTDENQQAFPQSKEQKAGLGFPLARLLAIISLSCGAVLEWTSGPCEGKGSGEPTMLRGLVNQLSGGEVLLVDRYYAGYFMLALLLQQGVDVVVRQHQLRQTDFRRGKRLGKRDHVVSWQRPQRPRWMDPATYAGMPEHLTLREVRVGDWTLVSSLLDAKTVSKRDLNELYCWRWQIEVDLRSIKIGMQMDVLRCQSPDMVRKEIAAHLLVYNLVRVVMAQAARHSQLQPRQLSFTGAMRTLRTFEESLNQCPRRQLAHRYANMIRTVATLKLSHRPGRVEPRVRKRRPKNYPLMTQPRNVLRKPLIKQRASIEKRLR